MGGVNGGGREGGEEWRGKIGRRWKPEGEEE